MSRSFQPNPLKYLQFFLLCLVLAVAGCDSNDSEDGDDDDDGGNNGNRATIEVSGAINEEYSGTATYASAFGISWAITIELDDDKGSAVLSVVGDPDDDTFTIGESGEQGVVGVTITFNDLAPLQDDQPGTVVLTSGTVEFDDRDENRVEGSFSGQGEAIFSDLEVSVSGDFEANCFILCDIGG